MERIDVSSLEIRDYALSLGWALVKEAIKDGLFVLNSPSGDYTQLIFPKEESSTSFEEMSSLSISRLASFYKKTTSEVLEDIREVNDDVVYLRYYSENKHVNSISFEEAIEAITATKQMILSSASTIVNPVLFHPKLNRTEPQDLIKKTKFRHTKEGSFILKVAIPFDHTSEFDSQISLFNDDERQHKPFSRQSFELIAISCQKIVEAIDSNTIKGLYEEQKASQSPLISYNFCDSISKMFDEDRELPFELMFSCSKASLQTLAAPSIPQRVSFPFSYRGKIEELKDYLSPQNSLKNITLIGTVESLNGEVGTDGKRSGEVILSVLIDHEAVKAKANLSTEFYAIAISAHEKGGEYVSIKADVIFQKRNARIENILEFKLANR